MLSDDIRKQRGLSKRDRRLITVQVLTALYRTGQFPNYVHRTLNAGSSKEENGVLIVDNTVYAGLRPPNREDHGAGVRRAVDELEATVSPPANPATD